MPIVLIMQQVCLGSTTHKTLSTNLGIWVEQATSFYNIGIIKTKSTNTFHIMENRRNYSTTKKSTLTYRLQFCISKHINVTLIYDPLPYNLVRNKKKTKIEEKP